MGLPLQIPPAPIQLGAALREPRRDAKELEVVGLQVHVNKKPPSRNVKAAAGERAALRRESSLRSRSDRAHSGC